jgi:hypothetical protein
LVTYFVVQAYKEGKNGYPVPDEAVEVPSKRHALLLCDKLLYDRLAIVAFFRTGDPATGEWQDAEIIFKGGEVTDELLSDASAA